MTTYIEMFNVDNYDTWDKAENHGAIYTMTIHSVDEPRHGAGKFIMNDIIAAINETAIMLVGTPNIKTRYWSE